MSNYLKMAKQNLILALKTLGWSMRHIQWEIGVRREAISEYVRCSDAKAAISPTGPLRMLNCDTGLY
ncbi:MAG TPA: hypothetical protein PLG17_01490 [Thermodesulfobacteriota bacterium]|nr:hypothetical protein [Deltaproteobacteria bacterium]HQO77164.1 hypothetical protein [Thermodesulfobacteriota bacterium]